MQETTCQEEQMFKWEQKLIDWINRYMIHISIGFVIIAAAWIRMGGRNFVGIEYHYSLYDIPGNCNSWVYRNLAFFFIQNIADSAIVILKYLAYIGDFAVAFLTLLLMRRKLQKENLLNHFFVLTVCLLSPVALLYSVSGMKIDSICMASLLAGVLLSRRNLWLPAVLFSVLPGFIYPAYWPLGIGLTICVTVGEYREKRSAKTIFAAVFLMAFFLILSVFMENHSIGSGYFWGKIFVIDPHTGARYSGFWQWLLRMFRIYGYASAMSLMLFSLRYKKLRIPALILQIAVIMYVGWQQTSFLAV